MRGILQKNPDWADAFEFGGNLARQNKDYATAETWLKKSTELNPNEFRYQRSLGDLYFAEGKTDLARTIFTKLVADHPNDMISNLRAAELYESLDWPKAEGFYKHCLELDPNSAVVKNNLAFAYLTHQGNIDIALKLAQEAKEAAPQEPSINDTLAWAYEKKGGYNEAVEFLKQSLQTSPDQPTYNYHIACAYAKLGDKAEAKMALLIALKTPSFASTKDGSDARQLLSTLN
jgi:predicted Zn-dependent protease